MVSKHIITGQGCEEDIELLRGDLSTYSEELFVHHVLRWGECVTWLVWVNQTLPSTIYYLDCSSPSAWHLADYNVRDR